MSLPTALTQFKSAGVYRLVYDKSTVLGQDTSIIRLVIGYSNQGPFNIPVLVNSISEFKALFGEASKTLEKRGVYFHRIANQCLLEGPIVALNLKRFSTETLYGATVDTSFNPTLDPIDVVEIKVEDIYDTTRFWELSAFKLAEISDVNGKPLDGYISISATNTKATSGTFFIRKASGSKVSGYNVTVNDWYKDSGDDIPEYLQDHLNSLISDFFAEIYVFKGHFTADQVLASETLSKYFVLDKDEENNNYLRLRNYVTNAYGDPVDTLDALFSESTSGAVNHYIGALIPYFKDKQNVYQSLDIIFNQDVDTNNMMMNFNVDMLEDGEVNIDLSGRLAIPATFTNGVSIDLLKSGEATTTLLGNDKAPVITDTISFSSSFNPITSEVTNKRISGNLYASEITTGETAATIILKDIKDTVDTTITLTIANKYVEAAFQKFGIQSMVDTEGNTVYYGGIYKANLDTDTLIIPEKNIVSITGYGADAENIEYSPKINFAFAPVVIASNAFQNNIEADGVTPTANVYGSSVSFVPVGSFEVAEYDGAIALVSTSESSLVGFFNPGDCLLAGDGTTDPDNDTVINDPDGFYDNVYVQEVGSQMNTSGVITYFVKLSGEPLIYNSTANLTKIRVLTNPGYEDWVGKEFYITSAATVGDTKYQLRDENGAFIDVDVTLDSKDGDIYTFTSYGHESGVQYTTGTAKSISENVDFVIRIDAPLNQEVGIIKPVYLEGYTYANPKPSSTSMYDKQLWQDFILSTLTDYKGIRTGLLNKSEIDYRYIIDTFESYVTEGCKKVLSFLAKEKDSCFAILNFPSVRTFVKCPYTSFTDGKGIFNAEYIVKGYNPKKSHSATFTLPSESEGASWCAFYTPLKFSDGYIDTMVPSAGLVSNLFIEKYRSRQPYYIIAGPNYGVISASGMTGPDYNFSRDELNVLEPYGVNCMVYRPGFGTFINANQTAKQSPKSALSAVNVRELVIYIQDEIEKILQSYQWEFNNAVVRAKIKDKADLICERVLRNGGIQDYLNIMDESNNTPEVIDNEFAILSTHIEPGRGMGKMVQELTLYRTGMMRATISEA